MRPPPMDDEFVGMTDYIMESFHDLLAGDLEEVFDSDSSKGSHHPSRECFMADGPHHEKTPRGAHQKCPWWGSYPST
jgi:hypothetical protein